MKVEYHPSIKKELRDIIDYYEKCSKGLGYAFLDEFEKQVLKISSIPEQWMVLEGGMRRSLMERFPYVIYFRIISSDILRVTVVKHQKRHPKYGKNRR